MNYLNLFQRYQLPILYTFFFIGNISPKYDQLVVVYVAYLLFVPKGGSSVGGLPLWGTPKLQKEGKTSRACAGMWHILVISWTPPPPAPFPKSCIRPCRPAYSVPECLV